MGNRNYYGADKRNKELKRKKKQQEKLERKRQKKLAAPSGESDPGQEPGSTVVPPVTGADGGDDAESS